MPPGSSLEALVIKPGPSTYSNLGFSGCSTDWAGFGAPGNGASVMVTSGLASQTQSCALG
jgi:hypothetical protein